MSKRTKYYAVYRGEKIWDGPLTLHMARKTATARRKQTEHKGQTFTVARYIGILTTLTQARTRDAK